MADSDRQPRRRKKRRTTARIGGTSQSTFANQAMNASRETSERKRKATPVEKNDDEDKAEQDDPDQEEARS